MIAEYAAGLAVLTWITLLLARGRFWQIREADFDERLPLRLPRVAVLVPARDEARVVPISLASLLQQNYPGPFHIFFADDNSADGTSDAALQTAKRTGATDRLTVIRARPLASGWIGKPWALSEALEAAEAFKPDLLLLTDADIKHPTDEISRLVAKAEAGGYDLVSLMVRLETNTFTEKLLMPAFVFFFFKLYPPRWVASPYKSTAGAAGGCILLRRSALDRAGGMAVIRSEVIDDCALAKAVKSTGGKLWLGITSTAVTIGGYGSAGAIGGMISRTAFTLLRHSPLRLAGALFGMFLTYLLPPIIILSFKPAAMLCGAAAWGLMGIAAAPIYRHYRLCPVRGFLMPAVALFYSGAVIHSAIQYWRGKGAFWKGRVQDLGAPQQQR